MEKKMRWLACLLLLNTRLFIAAYLYSATSSASELLSILIYGVFDSFLQKTTNK